ncbi:MAG: AAA family ATPase [Saprospiraceae bacterium]|nr:AAA family ATPase [Saprospiraceae bacterium]MCF8249454.1 AAA family ATPase [Saprospiraceae bacterium]MCF8279108.1 AAA family ATPase [Bacteroidales bacterium]MCF8311583.1 AAA family ATPase [Saprospiraceae bacterium]MCF8440073.1 AAA family ATPase [Saprospiraceae bacterium]
MYHKRLIDSYLNEWKVEANRKPLMLRGARQVGKSSAVRQLAAKFEQFVEVNFEETPNLQTLFAADLDPIRIAENLSVFFGKPIVPGRTLLFFDEIQACPTAISSLRFFYEKMPELHVVAAGSLLEFALQSLPSYGVGRVRSLFMYPFSFHEFLGAMGEQRLLDAKRNAGIENPLPDIFHQKLLDYLKTFLLTGGMPEAVAKYANSRQLLDAQLVLDDLYVAFQADFTKYKNTVPPARLVEVMESVVQQTGGKFMYSKASATANHGQIKEALELLIMAGLVLPVTHTAANGIPPGAEADPKKRKMLLLDTGIFQRILGLDLSDFLFDPAATLINKGVIAEQFWGLEYLKYNSPWSPPSLYYWHRESANANAEVDYVMQVGADLLPIEVKSSGKGAMQSLRHFLKEKGKPFGYRFSLENFSEYGDIKSFPLYAVSNLVAPVVQTVDKQ